MPTWRKLHTKATESLDINDMPDDFHRLLWVMLPLGLDREGRGMDNPAWVKAKIMPLRTDVTPEMVEVALTWYAEHGMIERYQVAGRPYFWVPTFAQYQGNTQREAESEYPAPPDQGESRARLTHDQLVTKSSSDADADADADAEAEAEADARSRAPDGGGGDVGGRDSAVTDEDVLAGALFEEVERTGVLVNATLAEAWLDAIEDHRDWLTTVDIHDAFLAAAKANVPRPGPAYVRAILDRCKKQNVRPGQERSNGHGPRASPEGVPTMTDAELYLENALRGVD